MRTIWQHQRLWVPVFACGETGMTREGDVQSDHTYWVYIVASGWHRTLYVGVTNSLERRIAEHRSGEVRGFTQKHRADRLVYFRGFGEVTEAICFEKQLKRWRREWKVRLIEADNPHWADLYPQMMAPAPLNPDIAAALAENGAAAPRIAPSRSAAT